ncbi:hypothetical protein [Pararhodobacter oceanensis]|uniref:hypothetical protein n=1 Tax=Pararhodobacter oceanensis TaxID=2172121 RepID=UPI003A8F0E3B
MWDADQIDALTEVVVRRLLVEGGTARALAAEIAGQLAAETPELPGLALALPFTLAAGGIEDMLGAGHQAYAAAVDAWRVSALIGAEVLGLQAMTQAPVSVADLNAHWQSCGVFAA